MIENNNNTNLILYDINNFLIKYTRFLSKDIYINYNTYKSFMMQYKYIYQKIKDYQFLYQENKNYQQIERIKKEEKELLKLHNQKYLKRKKEEYTNFFNENKITDNNQKNIILSNENKLIYFNNKNNISFITAKIKLAIQNEKVKQEKFIILTKEKESREELKKILSKNDLEINCYLLEEYQEKLLKEKEQKITYSIKYHIFKEYLLEILYPNKKDFTKFYKEFKNSIYLNKDYKDFDTFKDYHSYLYKRMYLESKLSLKDFIEKEIIKRKNHFRTILNEKMSNETEVNIANFLYLNNINYIYIKENHLFSLKEGLQIHYINQEKDDLLNISPKEKDIYLYQKYKSEKKTLEVLTYELIKRRYPMEKKEEEEIYNTLKKTTMDSYITEFISKTLIPLTEDSNIIEKYNSNQKQELTKILTYYQKSLIKNNYIEEKTLNQRTEKELENTYPIFLNITNIIPKKNYLIIVENNYQNTILNSQLKLKLEYKNYLKQKKWFIFPDTYLSFEELTQLTEQFLQENITSLNQIICNQKAKIKVFFYQDNDYFKEKESLALTINNLLNKLDKNNVEIILSKKEEISELIKNSIFKYQSTTTISNNKEHYNCSTIEQSKKKYQNIILPFFINNTFNELQTKKEIYEKKLFLATCIINTKENIFILSPISKEQQTKSFLKNFKNITYKK